ncbi:hypothetical protein IGX29_15535 [Streptomyces sp. H28]|uniref:hypothetical protein n=1 Tax=Streptomyces sp. H28 TaxID=2775865 RepID=UPI00177C2355|nr:hypothetical protein [Streptomyces sp. H28]MBD9733191.1 hypothetical protein [Streptomyces sp. H28]
MFAEAQLMYLVSTTVPAGALPCESPLIDRIHHLARPEDRLEHVHVLRAADGGTHLTLFLGHPGSRETERAAARLVARALPPAVGACLDWAPALPLLSALEDLRAGGGTGGGFDGQIGCVDKELPSQDPDIA